MCEGSRNVAQDFKGRVARSDRKNQVRRFLRLDTTLNVLRFGLVTKKQNVQNKCELIIAKEGSDLEQLEEKIVKF